MTEKLNVPDTRVLTTAQKIGTPFTPTVIGMEIGYERTRASSRVAPQLKSLTEKGLLSKTGEGKATSYTVTETGASYSA